MGNENFVSMSEMWTYGTENGIIDENEIRAQMEMGERNKYIEAHEDEIWFVYSDRLEHTARRFSA